MHGGFQIDHNFTLDLHGYCNQGRHTDTQAAGVLNSAVLGAASHSHTGGAHAVPMGHM